MSFTECWRNNMKKIIFAIIISALLLVSCGEKSADTEAPPVVTNAPDITETIASTETATESESETAAELPDFDFESTPIVGYKTVNVGDEFELEWEGESFATSHPSVCSLDGKKATAHKKGVSLIGAVGEGRAYAVCVLPEGVTEDPMAGTPTLLEVGKTSFVEGFGSSEHYTVSDPEVASLNGQMVEALSPGYVIIDVSNISMPKFFSFIVFDRVTD